MFYTKTNAQYFCFSFLLLFVTLPHSLSIRAYDTLPSPRQHPLYLRHHIRPAELSLYSSLPTSGASFVPGFAAIRSFDMSDPTSWAPLLDLFTKNAQQGGLDLANIVWPGYATAFSSNWPALCSILRDRTIPLTDMGGFVPGGVQDFDIHTVASVFEQGMELLGPLFLGFDMGEQDVRYLWGYAFNFVLTPATTMPTAFFLPSPGESFPSLISPSSVSFQSPFSFFPSSSSSSSPSSSSSSSSSSPEPFSPFSDTSAAHPYQRLQHLFTFLEYSYNIERKSNGTLAALSSSVFGVHHWLQSGMYTLAGSETSQSNGNAQVLYAFVRGAAKQYGTLWFGQVSIFNSFGYKIPGDPSPSPQCLTQADHSPTCGTSLSLMKRLMYTQLAYNSAYFAFEGMWTYVTNASAITPIGVLQQQAKQVIRRSENLHLFSFPSPGKSGCIFLFPLFFA